MIRLRTFVPIDILTEAADMPPIQILTPPAMINHAYAKAAADGAGKHYQQKNIDFSENQSDSEIITASSNVIRKFENSQNNPSGGYNKQRKLWFPHKSIEGGAPTIAYGHKMLSGENFSQGITDDEAVDLLKKDVRKRLMDVRNKMKHFDTLPLPVKIAALNAYYRGDLGPRTMDLLNQNKFSDAAREYLKHNEYRTTRNLGVKKRMEYNAAIFKSVA